MRDERLDIDKTRLPRPRSLQEQEQKETVGGISFREALITEMTIPALDGAAKPRTDIAIESIELTIEGIERG